MNIKLLTVILSAFSIAAQPAAVFATPNLPNVNHQVVSNAKIDLNKANAESLMGIVKGIGKKRATAIVAYRTTHGQFKSIEDLSRVHGMGKQFVKNNLLQLKNKLMIN